MSQLPAPSEARQPSEIDVWDVWHDVVLQVKKRIIQPSFWQAVETVIPITLDGNLFVTGLPVAAGHYASLLNGSENRRRLEQIINELTGLPLTLRMIDGTEESDWEEVKKRDQAAQNAQAAMRSRIEAPQAQGRPIISWEALQERIYSLYSRSQGHHLPQGRVQYLLQALDVLAEGSQRLYDLAPQDKDRNDRALARILDKIAGLVEMPAASVALEFLRVQQSKGKTS